MKLCLCNDHVAGAVTADRVYPVGAALIRAGFLWKSKSAPSLFRVNPFIIDGAPGRNRTCGTWIRNVILIEIIRKNDITTWKKIQ